MINLLEPSNFPVVDLKFPCPHCSQHLEAPVELAGSQVECPVCRRGLVIPAAPASDLPPDATPGDARATAGELVKYWTVDARVLVLRAPPVYLTVLIEVPKGWMIPADGVLPPPALEALTKAVRAKYPQCPLTPARLRNADPDAVSRISGHPDQATDSCRVWLLGKAGPSL